ncbi:MAG TPA: preprotein translocase subunit SecE [Acidimicrobiia bacterium]
MSMNRQTKRQMAKTGMDQPRRTPPSKTATATLPKSRTTPAQYLREVQGEMRKVVWPTRPEVINSTIIVLIAIIFMGALIFVFDWSSVHIADFLFG